MSFRITTAVTQRDISHVLAIRRAVFIQEQGVSEALEMDGLDDSSRHYLLWQDSEPAATLRTRRTDAGTKIERMAVLRSFRRRGLGRALMDFVLTDLASDETVILHAQTAAQPFYAGLGFDAEGDTFDEAGITHIRMVLRRRTAHAQETQP